MSQQLIVDPDSIKPQKVTEGRATILVQTLSKSTGPMKKSTVFYNPAMALNRDTSVALMSVLLKQGCSVLDGLAATGIRGIRLVLEAGKDTDIELTLNDANPVAHLFIKKNLKLNKVIGNAANENVNAALSKHRYWHVDIDPYGTPAPFLDTAIQGTHNKGVLAVTATDTAVLCGTYSQTAARRYMVNITKNHCYHETSVRVLLGCIARLAAVHDRGIEPLLGYTTNHYVRLFLRVREGAARADACLDKVGKFGFDNKTHEFLIGEGEMGPIWLGEIHDAPLLKKVKVTDTLAQPKKLERMLALWRAEAGMPAFYYDIDEISRLLKSGPPRMESIAAAFEDAGMLFSRTHFLPTGFKTDAGVEDVKRIIKGIAGGR